MSCDNLPSIDFSKVASFVNERDLKLWKQQAIAKYSKIKYESLRKENEMLDKKINKYKDQIKKAEEEMPIIKALSQQMMMSITLTSDVMDQLIQRKIDAQNEIVAVKRKYEAMIDKYCNAIEHKKEYLGKNNSLYKEMNEQRIAVEKIKIQRMILHQSVEEQKRMIKLKKQINKEVLNYNIIEFVKAVKYAQELNAISNKLRDKRILAQNLLKTYEEVSTRKERIENLCIVQSKELPKLSLQINAALQFPEFKIPTRFPILVQTTHNTTPAIDEVNLLKNLRQRSDERHKMICQGQSTRLFAPRSMEPKYATSTKVSSNINDEPATDIINDKEKIGNKENIKPLSKVKLLQNEILTTDNCILKHDVSEKRKPNEEPNSIIKSKKIKRVSFGECLSQDDGKQKPIHNLEQAAEATSPYFPNIRNELNARQGENLDNFFDPLLEHMPAAGFQLTSEVPDFTMGGFTSKDQTGDYSFVSDKSADNENTFCWSQPSSEQTTGFRNGFGNLF